MGRSEIPEALIAMAAVAILPPLAAGRPTAGARLITAVRLGVPT